MNDKEILDRMNKDENYRSDVLINFNFEMQLAQNICYAHKNKFSPQEYKLAVVSLEQENVELKENYKAILKQRDDTNKSAVETIEKYQQENARLKDKINIAIKYYELNQQECVIGRNKDDKLIKEYYLPAQCSKKLLDILKEN